MIKSIQKFWSQNPEQKQKLKSKSILTLFICLVLGIGGVRGQIVAFDFAGIAGNESTVNATTTNSNLGTCTISRGAGLTASINADRFNASGWATTSIANAISGNDYMEFTITPNSGFQFSVSSIVFQIQRSGTGLTAIALRNSVDNYASNLDAQKSVTDNTSTQTFTFTFTQTNSSTPVTYRLYGFAESATGTGGPGDGTGNDITINGTVSSIATSTIVLSNNSQITSGNINQGATDQIISRFSAVVTDADATLNSLTFNAGGTFVAGDITNFKLYTSTSNTFPGGTALSSVSAVSIANAGAVSFSGLNQSNAIGTRYYWITADISGSAAALNTIEVPSLSNSNFTFASGNVSGTISAGGSQTIQVVTPSISIGSNHPASSSINQNSTNQVIGSINLAVTNTNATLSAFTVTTAGTYNISDLVASSFKLYFTTTNSFSATTQIGSGQAIVASGNSITFSGLSQTINNGSTGYLWVTCDVAYNAVNGNTISLASTAFSNISFVSGNLSGTNPVAASNTMTISAVTPSIAIAFVGPSSGVADIPSTNLILHQFSLSPTINSADLTSITATTGGSYSLADLVSNSFKLWYNTFNTFGTATQIGSSQAVVSSGNTITFGSLAQKLTIGTTGYFWITVDISGSATNGNTIFVDANAFSNLVFANANKTGTDPVSAGGTKTLTTQVTPGSIVINQFSADYSGASDEFIELVNLTNQAIDLSSLKLNYLSSSGSGTYSSALTGTIPANGFWLLSPNANVTVGQTSLSSDGSFTAGFSTAGQIAIRRISDNTIIDGLAYGTISSNSNLFGEGSAATAAPTDGALKRITDGADAGANSTDFTTVANGSIYLRNSGSRLGISGSTISTGTYRDMTITGNTSLSGTVSITNKVEVVSGTLTTSGNLVLKSDASGTASIANSAGAISGNITVERYIPGGASRRRTRLLASPVVGGTALQWRNNGTNAAGQGIQITGTGGASNGFDVTNNTNNPPSAWSYDPTLAAASSNSNGADWVGFTSGSMSLQNGKGYRVLVRGDRLNDLTTQSTTTSSTTIWVSGSYPGNSVTINTVRSSDFSNGWNLIGNPYPSPISWSAVTKGADVDASYWVFDPSSNSYLSHNGSTGTANNVIGSGQAFFVRRNQGTTGSAGDITIAEANKTTGTPIYMGKTSLENLEYIMTYDSNNSDRGIISFDESYSDGFDKMDAEKLSNPSINISSLDADGNRLSINSLNRINTGETKSVKLDIRNSVQASYTLSFARLETIESCDIFLRDKFLNKFEQINPGFTYNFTLSADSNSFGSNRFELVFTKSTTGIEKELNKSNSISLYPNPATNAIFLYNTKPDQEQFSYFVYDQNGKEVSTGTAYWNAGLLELNIESLSSGVFFVKITNSNSTQTIKFIK
ncbi:MAG: T9SS type A sorting domain-containing protein [Bacteroidia bacterium]|nr:T9SS type A sorting domain-containing protein [Bacteroidia bacterium]